MIATEPVTAPATSLSTIRTEFEAIERAAARERDPWPPVIRQPCAARHPPASHAAASRAARPRCEIRSFSASDSSAIVRLPSPSAGTNSGS